jgi:hypothetical protein
MPEPPLRQLDLEVAGVRKVVDAVIDGELPDTERSCVCHDADQVPIGDKEVADDARSFLPVVDWDRVAHLGVPEVVAGT